MSTLRAGLVLRHVRGLARPAEDDGLLVERFTLRRDEPAFAELVRRHGPMVLGVCRRILRDAHAAEDVFQATFLVLARKSASISKGESVGGWLYRVAYHAAVRARKQAAVRQGREERASHRSVADALDEVTGRELMAVLDSELARLPQRYRAPLVLCYLEGKTRDEAAQQLRCSLSTLKRRLEEGRNCLRSRLERRGLGLPAVLLSVGVATASVPAALAASATRTALVAASAEATPLLVRTASLVVEALRTFTTDRRKTVAAVLLAVGLLLASAGLFGSDQKADEPRRTPAGEETTAKRTPPPGNAKEERTVVGQVLDSDGKSVPGARVAVIGLVDPPYRGRVGYREYEILGAGKTDGEGRFRLNCSADAVARARLRQVIASARGHGLAGSTLARDADKEDLVVKLPVEQVIRGRLIDLQGLPARAVKLHVAEVGPAPPARTGSSGSSSGGGGGGGGGGSSSSGGASDNRLPVFGFASLPRGLDAWPAAITTDDEGRFSIRGLGKDMSVVLRVDDERFARQGLIVRTMADGKPEAFEKALEPPHLLEGRVVGEDTGKPIGKKVLLDILASEHLQVWADEDGRFRVNCPPGRITIHPYPPDGSAYLSRSKRVDWPKGKVKHEVEVGLPRGVLVRGKVVETGTDRPVVGAIVSYTVREDNPFADYTILSWKHAPGESVRTKSDGTFEATVYPGPGTLLAKGPTRDYILQRLDTKVLSLGKPGGAPLYAQAWAPLDLKAGADGKEVVLKLMRGLTVKGRIVGPDDTPVESAVIYHSLAPQDNGDRAEYYHYALVPHVVSAKDGAFTLTGLDPKGKVPVCVLDRKNQSGARVILSGKEEATIKLQPCGKITTRLVDPEGKPIIGRSLNLQLVLDADTFSFVSHVETLGGRRATGTSDAEGRLTVLGLIPGATYSWFDGRKTHELTAEAGKTHELPDVVIHRPRW